MNAIKSLDGEIVDVNSISDREVNDMYQLMSSYYDNVNRATFQKDLFEKRDVILLRDSSKGKIKGFSTLMLLEQTVEENSITVLFSGDTIIDREYWGTNKLLKLWGRYAFSLIDEMPNRELYWLLISKGYKTYRFLPVFFNEFYPRRGIEFPRREKRILDAFASLKFPGHYDQEKGIISFGGEKDYLKQGVADIDESRLKNPDVGYFIERNPGWERGDELACLIRLTKENFNRLGRRIIGK